MSMSNVTDTAVVFRDPGAHELIAYITKADDGRYTCTFRDEDCGMTIEKRFGFDSFYAAEKYARHLTNNKAAAA